MDKKGKKGRGGKGEPEKRKDKKTEKREGETYLTNGAHILTNMFYLLK